MNPRRFWLALYLIANVYSIAYTLTMGELIGDLDGFQYTNIAVVLVAGIGVLLSYFGLMTVGFESLSRRFAVVDAMPEDSASQRMMGRFVAGGQVLFFLFNLAFGINQAGSTERVPLALYFIWILIPFDSLAPLYFAQAPSSRIRVANLAIFVVSNLARGWSGPLLLVFSIEWMRAYRSNKKGFAGWVFPALIPLGLVLYPVVLAVKWYLRASSFAPTGSFMDVIDGLPSPTSDDYALLFQTGIHQLMGRLQLASNVVDLWANARTVQTAFQDHQILPFWLEGLHGIIFNRVTGHDALPISGWFTNVGDFPPRPLEADSDWNTNTSWIGWFIACPELIPLYLLYTFALCYISMRLMAKTSRNRISRDFIWLAWLLYLLPGWLGAFTSFIYGQVVFLAIRRLLERLATKRARAPMNPDAPLVEGA